MVTTTCEKLKCPLFDKENIVCTDNDPRYEYTCRYNSYWETEEGRAELAAYEPRGNEPVITSFNDMHTAWRVLAKVNPANPLVVAEAVPEMYEELKNFCKACSLYEPECGDCKTRKILAKIHGKEA